MYWQEKTDENFYTVPGDVVDLAFRIDCRALPVDHAWSLSEGIKGELPWFSDAENSGLHLIHGAESGNGWTRPVQANDLIYPSHRTPLILRLPEGRIDDAMQLTGRTLEVAGGKILVKRAKSRPLAKTKTLYSRHVIFESGIDEELFIKRAVAQLKGLDVRFSKLLCGQAHIITTPKGSLETRSLMISDLPYEDSVQLQQQGLGQYRSLGCGLFIAYKAV